MRAFLSILTVSIACAVLTSACASFAPPPAPPDPPRRDTPALAARPCALPVLPADATLADLEAVYIERGAAVIACDAARQLMVDVHEAGLRDLEAWTAAVSRSRQPAWRRWLQREPDIEADEP